MGSNNPVGEGLFDSLGHGYVRMVENLLFATYPEMNIRVTNSGISGNTSRDLLNRWQRDVLDLKPDPFWFIRSLFKRKNK
jgi:lysophospholipase L1-like esterase